MKKLYILTLLLLIVVGVKNSYSQRILVNEGFETSGFNIDSLPNGWTKDPLVGPNPSFPLEVWSARDSGAFLTGVNGIIRSRAHTGTRGASIGWRAGNPIANSWLFTDVVNVQAGDSLIFWMLMGTPEDVPNLTHYIDSMQVLVSSIPVGDPSFATKLATIVSPDSNNVWTQYKFVLSQFAGQSVYIAFRYYMDTSDDGLWCNIDDIFIGNRSHVGITQTGTNVPAKFDLKQNYPNPFNPATSIKFDLPKNTDVNLTVFNMNGQEVATLANGYYNAGSYEASFDARTLTSGTYFYRLTTKDFVQTKKMTLVK